MAVVIARSLAEKGIEVISCDSVGLTAASFSQATIDNFIHADPDKNPEQYLKDLKDNIRKYAPEDDRTYMLMPGFRDAKFLAENKEAFEGTIILAAPPFEAINLVDPKHHLMETLGRADIEQSIAIPAPKTLQITDIDKLDEAMAELKMPALIKAVDDVGGRGIEFFDDRRKMQEQARARIQSENPPPLLQEAADGEDYCLAVICRKGEILAHMAYHNLQNMPSEGGAGAMRETIDDTPFLESASKLLALTEWTGVAEIDFMWDGDSKNPPLLIEVNPRFWAGLFQSVESGIDFPWLLYHLFAYGDVPYVDEAEIGTRTKLPAIWATGALSDALSDGIDWDGAKSAWSDMVEEAKSGDMKEAFDLLKTSFAHVTDISSALALFRKQSAHAKQAKSELMLGDDPLSSLGVFFVLSSLVRHGELPAELKR